MRGRQERWAAIALGALVVVYVLAFSVLSILRYETFHATTFDLGYFSQVVWNTAHGRWFETSVSRSTQAELVGSYLGEHVALILAAFAPLYRLWPDPRLLLILQSAALGLGAVPLYALVRRRAGRPITALVVAGSYLLHPALGFANLFDVHPIAFSVPLVLLAAWALEEERPVAFWIGVVLALLTKEEMVIPLGTWGLITALRGERRHTGLSLLIVATVWAGICFGVIIPAFNEGQSYKFLNLWSILPGVPAPPSSGGIAQATAAASPEAVALFLVHLLLPLGFLPFLSPGTLAAALPSLAYLLLGRRAAFHSVGYHYPSVLIPWFFLALVEGLEHLPPGARGGRTRLRRVGLTFLAAGTLGTNVMLNPVVLQARAGFFRREPYHDQIAEALEPIPPAAPVAAGNRFGPALASRQILVPVEYPPPLRLDHVAMTDYVLLDLVDCRTVPAVDQRQAYAEMVMRILDTELFRVGLWEDRILLLERGEPTQERLAEVRAYVRQLVEDDRPCWP